METPKVYLIFDEISPRLRVVVSVLLISAGFLIQVSTRNILAGLPFIIFCALLNIVKSVSIKKVMADKLTWQGVTAQKIDEVIEHCRRVKKFRSGNLGCFVAFIIGVVFFGGFIFPVIQDLSPPFPVLATIANAFILFTGLILSGRKSAWIPRALDIKVGIIKGIIESTLVKDDPTLMAAPYLEIGDTGKGTFPNDTRILIKFKDAPDEFIGLQGQISINTVKSRNYPYFYVVIIARHAFKLFEKFKSTNVVLDNITIEQKRTAEVDVIVIRQTTTKTSGYHTDQKVRDRILSGSIKLAKRLV